MDDQTRPSHPSAEASGRAQGEAFEAALRQVEERERTERLTRLAAANADWSGGGTEAAPTEVARLRSQVEKLAAFRAAVLDSKAWRLIESVRRFFGRAW